MACENNTVNEIVKALDKKLAEDVDLRKVRYKEPGGGKKQVHVYKSKKVKK